MFKASNHTPSANLAPFPPNLFGRPVDEVIEILSAPNRLPDARALRTSSEGARGREALSGQHILIVEDEMFITLDLELAIEDVDGIPVGPIQTVEEGLAFLAVEENAAKLSAAILDINLHGEDVFPVAEVLKWLEVPFLFHTGHGKRAELQGDWADVPVFQKPIDPDRLLDAVARLIE